MKIAYENRAPLLIPVNKRGEDSWEYRDIDGEIYSNLPFQDVISQVYNKANPFRHNSRFYMYYINDPECFVEQCLIEAPFIYAGKIPKYLVKIYNVQEVDGYFIGQTIVLGEPRGVAYDAVADKWGERSYTSFLNRGFDREETMRLLNLYNAHPSGLYTISINWRYTMFSNSQSRSLEIALCRHLFKSRLNNDVSRETFINRGGTIYFISLEEARSFVKSFIDGYKPTETVKFSGFKIYRIALVSDDLITTYDDQLAKQFVKVPVEDIQLDDKQGMNYWPMVEDLALDDEKLAKFKEYIAKSALWSPRMQPELKSFPEPQIHFWHELPELRRTEPPDEPASPNDEAHYFGGFDPREPRPIFYGRDGQVRRERRRRLRRDE